METKQGKTAVLGDDNIMRIFENADTYNKWLKATEKGHSMLTLTMIDTMIQIHREWTAEDIQKAMVSN